MALVLLGVALLTPSQAAAEGLADAIALAYQTNPSLLAARADLRALDERYVQARAALGPTATVTEQHSVEDAYVQQPASFFAPATTQHSVATTDTAQLAVSQPLYSGGQLNAAISASEADVLSGRAKLKQEEADVLSQVIEAYADVLLAQELVTIASQNVVILNQQLAETQAKFEVKESTLTDRSQTRARLTAAQINLVQARAGLTDAQAKYLAAVGESPGQLEPLPDLPGVPPSVDAAFDAADKANPQLLAAIYAERASHARIAEAKAANGLQIGLSVGLTQQPAAPYIQDQNARGVIATLNVSKLLFTSGAYSSRVHEAAETNVGDELRVSAEQRQVILAVAQAWSDLASRREQISALAGQLVDEDQAFRGSRIEERIGLRTTIDVLNAVQEFQATKVALAQAYHDEYLNRVSLLSATGLLQAELLEPDLEVYRPEESLRKRTMLSRLLPWEELVRRLDAVGSPLSLIEPPSQDALGAQRPAAASAMPAAPNWSDLSKYLTNSPVGS